LPAIYPFPERAVAGGLMSYGSGQGNYCAAGSAGGSQVSSEMYPDGVWAPGQMKRGSRWQSG
jgi:hypothetical protein